METQLVAIDRLIPDPHNPRRSPSPEVIDQLADSMARLGIKVPLIVYQMAKGFGICDGHCRYLAAVKLGLRELPAVILAEKPSEAELLATQFTVNDQRTELNAVEEFEAVSRLMELDKLTASECAERLSLKMPRMSGILSIGKLSDEQRELVRRRQIPKSSAYALARMPPEQSQAMTQKAVRGELTRDELNVIAKKARPAAEGGRAKRFSCKLGEAVLSVQSKVGLQLPGLIDLLESLVRDCRKAKSRGLSIETALAVIQQSRQATSLPS